VAESICLRSPHATRQAMCAKAQTQYFALTAAAHCVQEGTDGGEDREAAPGALAPESPGALIATILLVQALSMPMMAACSAFSRRTSIQYVYEVPLGTRLRAHDVRPQPNSTLDLHSCLNRLLDPDPTQTLLPTLPLP